MKSIGTIITVLLFIQYLPFNSFAQDVVEEDNTMVSYKGEKGFHLGFYLGAFFPDKDPAVVYDGYGNNSNGDKNNFASSLMYQKIRTENDPRYGFTDRIATELEVIHENWRFEDESYMPTNLKYNTAFLIGIAMQYGFDKRHSIIANFNFAKLKAIGNFTIETYNSTNQTSLDWKKNQFAIVGDEQRMMIQIGYCRILGQNEKANFFIEGGLCVNNAKVEKNFVQINSLRIDLTYFDPNVQGASNIYYEQYTGWGFGGFAALGLNLTMNPKYTIQLLYTPSYEKVNLGPDPTTSLQHAIGLRAYYNF